MVDETRAQLDDAAIMCRNPTITFLNPKKMLFRASHDVPQKMLLHASHDECKLENMPQHVLRRHDTTRNQTTKNQSFHFLYLYIL